MQRETNLGTATAEIVNITPQARTDDPVMQTGEQATEEKEPWKQGRKRNGQVAAGTVVTGAQW